MTHTVGRPLLPICNFGWDLVWLPGDSNSTSLALAGGVTLKEWIEKRCGEDFDLVLDGRNQNCIGHVGALKPEVVAQSHATHVSFS